MDISKDSQQILRTRAITDYNLCIEKLVIYKLGLKTCKDEHRATWQVFVRDTEEMMGHINKSLAQLDDAIKNK